MSGAQSDRGAARLVALLKDAGARARATRRPVLVSIAEPAPVVDPLGVLEALAREAAVDGVLAAQMAGSRMYWARPADGFALAGLGAVVTLTGTGADRFAEIDRAWAALRADAVVDDPSGGAAGVGPVLMGGFAFEPGGPRTRPWEGFPSALLTLPRLQIAVIAGDCWITTTLLVGADGRPDVDPTVLARLRSRALAGTVSDTRPPPGPTDATLAFTDARPADEWRALVGVATAAIGEGAMAKVVLARAVHASAARPLDAAAAVRHLRAAFPECRVFGCWRDDRAFVGASPELLVRLDGHDVRADSLAGSMGRGATPDEDAARAAQLLASAKDRAEHEIVREALCGGMAELCDDVVSAPEPSILTLPHVHHLHTPVRARLRPGGSLLRLVAELHPTPAVGGAPREVALRFIREHECLDRGWYAAPVGWLGGDRGEFAVALRSALVAGNEAWLFTGCGVVEDSSPQGEYDESLLKLRPMQLALAGSLATGDVAEPAEPARAAAGGDGAR